MAIFPNFIHAELLGGPISCHVDALSGGCHPQASLVAKVAQAFAVRVVNALPKLHHVKIQITSRPVEIIFATVMLLLLGFLQEDDRL